MRGLRTLLATLALAAGLATGAARADEGIKVDAELVLAVDVSRSMTARELEIQRRGYAEALVSDEVVDAIARGYHGQVAMLFMEWAGMRSRRVVVGWTLIRGRDDAQAFADKLTADFSSGMRRTSISGAIDFAATLFEDNGFDSHRQVIDISGDGPNNDGRPVTFARDQALAQGVVINGLPLMTQEGMGMQWRLEDLDAYYYHCVIGGMGAFVIPVTEWAHFPQAVRRKLALELSNRPPEPRPRIVPAAAESYDCLIGEKIWDRLWGDGFN